MNQGDLGLIGTSPAMQEVYRVARLAAPSRATILITGESGTGKGRLAHAIHQASARAHRPFITLDCASLMPSLLESELFGHERGAFTGADHRRSGRFEQADGGTLFLDEVGEVPLPTQVKLLRVLQERTLERVGGNESVAVDVRVLAATNRDLVAAIHEGRFREDLYYRLNVVQVEMPPLRLRGEDLMVLATAFLERFARENGRPITGFSHRAKVKLLASRWPGNVRALENAIESAVVTSTGHEIDDCDLDIKAPAHASPDHIRIPGATLAEIERYALLKTLEATEGSRLKAAAMLDIGARTVLHRLRDYKLADAK